MTFACLSKRTFSSSTISRAGLCQKPIKFPSDLVQISVQDLTSPKLAKSFPHCSKTVHVKGPRGSLEFPLFPFVQVNIQNPTTVGEAGNDKTILSITVQNRSEPEQRIMQGTTRANIVNMVQGVTDGFDVTLRLVGIGYRAQVLPPSADHKYGVLSLRLGYAHPIDLPIPDGMTVSVPNPQRIFLNANDKQEVTQFAAKIRKYRPPEPYNQKGIFINDETIRKKEGKKR